MERYQIGLLITLLLGLFILIGASITLLVNKKEKIADFSIGLAFGVIICLIITDLLPEIFENLKFKNIYIAIIGALVGFFILKLLDHFIPDHHEDKMNKKEATNNLVHIGIITTVTLILHNIIEGMAVYSSTLSNVSLGVALGLGVGFHNIPLGMVITSSLYQNNKNLSKTLISIILVSLSTFIGGFIMYLFNLIVISNIVLGLLLALTLGMLLFIVIDELFPRISNMKEKKITYTGIGIGVLLLLISMIF
jgi:ZIP family zinc transporter